MASHDASWCAVWDDDGRKYFWNVASDETAWVRPHSVWERQTRLANEAMRALGASACTARLRTAARVGFAARLRTAARVGFAARLRGALDVWRAAALRPSRVDVHAMAHALEWQLRSRTQQAALLAAMSAEVAVLERALSASERHAQRLLDETLRVKLEAAAHEFDRLRRHARALPTRFAAA
jgi:hypothetical protein